jgi:hypothetical protein
MDSRPTPPDRLRLELVKELVAGACAAVDETVSEVTQMRWASDTAEERGSWVGTPDQDEPPLTSDTEAAHLILYAAYLRMAGEEMVRASESILADAGALTVGDRVASDHRQMMAAWHRQQAERYDLRPIASRLKDLYS